MAKKHPDYRPRVSFDIDSDLLQRLNSKLTHGDKKVIFTTITEQLVEMLERHDPELVKAGIVSKTVTLDQMLDYTKNKSNKDAS